MKNKNIDFDYWLSFETITISDVAILLSNEDPGEFKDKDFSSDQNSYLKLLKNAVCVGKIQQAVNPNNRFIDNEFTLISVINFLIESSIRNNNFITQCKQKKLQLLLNENFYITYEDSNKNITKREVSLKKITEGLAYVDDFSGEENPKTFKISNILTITEHNPRF